MYVGMVDRAVDGLYPRGSGHDGAVAYAQTYLGRESRAEEGLRLGLGIAVLPVVEEGGHVDTPRHLLRPGGEQGGHEGDEQ